LHAVGCPYFFLDWVYETGSEPVDECGPLTMLDGWLPLEALDCHTRPGKSSYNIWAKNHGDGSMSGNELGNIAFYTEGGLHRNSVPYSFSFRHLQSEMDDSVQYFSDDLRSWFENTVQEELNSIRTWVVHKQQRESFEVLKSLYDEVD